MNVPGGRRRLFLTCTWVGTWWMLVLGLGLFTWHERGAHAPLSPWSTSGSCTARGFRSATDPARALISPAGPTDSSRDSSA